MEIRLIVIRTADMVQLAEFYSLLGLTFEYHKHGKSPYHYSTTINSTVLEIYPLAKEQAAPDKELRLGFAVNDFDNTVQVLKDKGVTFITEPVQTDFGYLAIMSDPDGRKIEVYRK